MKLSLRLLFFPALLCMLAFAGCSGKDDNPAPTSHKIKYRAEVSAGSSLHTVVYMAASGQNTTLSNLTGTSWESAEFNMPAGTGSVSLAGVGVAADASAVLKVQIFVDGVMKKESTATGQTSFGASTTFYF